MGKIVSKMTRSVKMINIDNRAEKVISRSKPVPAPMYDSTMKQLELAKKVNPNFMEEHYKKDPELDDHLKSVYITSEDPHNQKINEETPDRPLPKDRHASEDFEYGFWEPDAVPKGKVTLRKIVEILGAHAQQPMVYNKNRLAKQFDLDPTIIEKLINNYGILEMKESEESSKKREEQNQTFIDRARNYAIEMSKPVKDGSI